MMIRVYAEENYLLFRDVVAVRGFVPWTATRGIKNFI